MKITKTQLKQIIQEELSYVLNEAAVPSPFGKGGRIKRYRVPRKKIRPYEPPAPFEPVPALFSALPSDPRFQEIYIDPLGRPWGQSFPEGHAYGSEEAQAEEEWLQTLLGTEGY